jgi:peroxiredoxin Q/BCP
MYEAKVCEGIRVSIWKGRMLKTGDKAPEFRLPADDGKEISLSDFRGKNVILYFFPKANTPG